jgi:hypothetical protein
MRQAALPIHNYMSTSAKQELLSTTLARRWNITSQIQFNGLNTGKVMKLLQVKATPRSLNEFYYSLKDNTEFSVMGEYEITLSNFNKFYEAYQKYRVYFEYVYVFLSQYCDPSCIFSYKGGDWSLKKLYVNRIPKDLGKKMLYGYGHREINRARTIEELWELMDNEVNKFFEQYEQHKQFDRRLIGESNVKDKHHEKGKSLSYSKSQSKSNTTANKPTSSNNYKKAGNVTTTYPPRKRYSNIREVVVEDADVFDKTGNGSDDDESLTGEYFGQMVQSKGNDQRPRAYGKDKIRPKSDKDDALPEICFRWF